jgi:hypothetical protein
MYYLSNVVHRPGPYKEYLRWLHQHSHIFLKPTYAEEHKANPPDSNNDNEIVDEYDTITRQGTQQLFQNYDVVLLCTCTLYFY